MILDNVDFIPSNVKSSHQEALLYVFEDNEAVIKMIIKGRSPTMRHVSRTHRVALDWFFDRINLDHISHVIHFSSTDCSKVMSKRTQKESSEERVTAKSKPMMNLVSRRSERTSDLLGSTASESLGKTRLESQIPLSSWNEQHQRTGRPVMGACSSNYSEWNVDKTWSSQEWKSDELMVVRTGRPVLFAHHTDRFIVENDNMDSYIEAEPEMS